MNRHKYYSTLDAYQAAFLSLRGHVPELLEENQKFVFVFANSDILLQDLTAYNSGALVEASRLASAVKTLKSQIHALRRDKGNDGQTSRRTQI